jgi:antitoxin PrlF
MARRSQTQACCDLEAKKGDCCSVESLVTVDERGQMVLPKELRERANIRAGDKLALISWQKDGELCCFTLIKAESLAERVKEFLGPVMKGMSLD